MELGRNKHISMKQKEVLSDILNCTTAKKPKRMAQLKMPLSILI